MGEGVVGHRERQRRADRRPAVTRLPVDEAPRDRSPRALPALCSSYARFAAASSRQFSVKVLANMSSAMASCRAHELGIVRLGFAARDLEDGVVGTLPPCIRARATREQHDGVGVLVGELAPEGSTRASRQWRRSRRGTPPSRAGRRSPPRATPGCRRGDRRSRPCGSSARPAVAGARPAATSSRCARVPRPPRAVPCPFSRSESHPVDRTGADSVVTLPECSRRYPAAVEHRGYQ